MAFARTHCIPPCSTISAAHPERVRHEGTSGVTTSPVAPWSYFRIASQSFSMHVPSFRSRQRSKKPQTALSLQHVSPKSMHLPLQSVSCAADGQHLPWTQSGNSPPLIEAMQ